MATGTRVLKRFNTMVGMNQPSACSGENSKRSLGSDHVTEILSLSPTPHQVW